MPTPDTGYDFFVSYARRDNETGWITRFVEALCAEHRRFVGGDRDVAPKRELRPFFDKTAIVTGADWQHILAEGIAHSQLFLAFISPNYFTSEWCRREWRAWMEAEIARHILTAGVRPIYIVEVPGLTGTGQLSDMQLAEKLAGLSTLPPSDKARLLAETPGVVKHLRRRQLTHNQPFCDVHSFFDAGLDALRRDDLRRVLDELARDLNHHADLCARADASLTTVPPYNRKFTGRLDELLLLRERLVKDDRTGVITGVHGLGGMGKTELAFAYAHAYASAYPGGRFLLQCEGKSLLRDAVLGQNDFTALFRDRIGDEERKQPGTYFAAVLACLRERIDQLGHVLLVLDNVSDPVLLTRQQTDTLTTLGPKLHLLATTRLAPPASGKGNWLSLGQLPDDDAMDLLEKHRPFANDVERDAARRIGKKLGGFTLAVELVAAWLGAHAESSSYTMLAEGLGLEDLETIAEADDLELCRHNHQRRLTAVLSPVLASLKPAERRALEYAALLPPDHVALPWLRALVVADFPELGQPGRLSDPWTDLWQRMEKLALFSRPDTETTEPRLLRIHRLVQELVCRESTEEERSARQQAVDTLVAERAAALEKETHWDDARWELEPFGALAGLWAETQHPQAAQLLSHAGQRWHALAEWEKAEPLFRHALAINEQSYGANHPSVATDLNNLAQLLDATNRFEEAEPLMRRALAIDELSYGENHPSVATDLNNLAGLLQTTNRLAEAEPLMRRALAIDEQSYGENHPAVARVLNNLAQLLDATNRFEEAESLMRRALAIDELSYGANHPSVARDLSNLAQLLQATNRLAEAEPLMRRALAIDELSYGANHPSVANRLNNLALLLHATNRRTEAEPPMRRALEIYLNFTRATGHPHPYLNTAIHNYDGLLMAMGQSEDQMLATLREIAPELFEESDPGPAPS